MASKAATDEGVEDESWGVITSFRVRSLDMDSLLFFRSPFLVLVGVMTGIMTGLVGEEGVSILGGMAGFADLSLLETRSVRETGTLSLSVCFIDVFDGGELYRYARGTIMMERTARYLAQDGK